jgi:uncharacterized membrane protein YjgN (DUF898 family)
MCDHIFLVPFVSLLALILFPHLVFNPKRLIGRSHKNFNFNYTSSSSSIILSICLPPPGKIREDALTQLDAPVLYPRFKRVDVPPDQASLKISGV